MKELNVLKLFCEKRDVFEKYGHQMKQIDNLEPAVNLLLKCIQEYYSKYPEHNYIGKEEFKSFHDYLYPNHREQELHYNLIDKFFDAEISTDIMEDLLEQILERHHASIMISKLLPVMQGESFGVIPKLQQNIDNFIELMKNPPDLKNVLDPCDLAPSELIDRKLNLKGAPWHLEALTSVLGPVVPGSLGLLFSYVDGGKTSFAMAAAKAFAHYYRESPETIAYCGNEESKVRLSQRGVCAFTGMSTHELAQKYSKEELDDTLADLGWHRLKIIDGVTTIRTVKKVLEEWDPVIMFIDQGSKVSMEINVKEIKETRMLYNTYRDLGKEHNCAIICIEQATGDAEFKQWINLADIYGSRVAIQGELDYAIGIGKTNERGRENFRYVKISKNKLLDGVTTAFPTYFDKERCVWKPV